MLKIIKKIDPSFNGKMGILKNGTYLDYLDATYPNPEDILICPTDAIDLNNSVIDSEKCIECMICPYFFSSQTIEYSEKNSFQKFSESVTSDKKYLTTWISQIITMSDGEMKCGLEVKIKANSRIKCIPLLITFNKKSIILKVVNSFKDIEYGLSNLEDINDIIKKYDLPSPQKIIVVNEIKTKYNLRVQKSINKLKEKSDFELIFIENIWNELKNGLSDKSINLENIFFSKSK